MWGFLSDRYFPLQPYDFPLHLVTGRGGYRFSFRALGREPVRPPPTWAPHLSNPGTWSAVTLASRSLLVGYRWARAQAGRCPIADGFSH